MDRIPNNLLVWIISHIYIDNDIDSLFNLSIVNRLFYRLTKNYIYKKFTLWQADPTLYFRTISTSPDLRECVKIFDWRHTGDDIDASDTVLSWADIGIFRISLEPHSGKDTYSERDSLEFGPLDSKVQDLWKLKDKFLYDLLFSMPKIEHLMFGSASMISRFLYWFKPLGANPELFANLRTACIQGPLHIQNIIPPLTLHSPRKLELVRVFDIGRTYEPTYGGPDKPRPFEWLKNGQTVSEKLEKGPHIEHFHVRDSSVTFQFFIPVLKAFHALKSFELGDTSMTERWGPNNFADLATALAWQRDSLESFSFSYFRLMRAADADLLLGCLQGHQRSKSLGIGPLFQSRYPHQQSYAPERLLHHLPPRVEHLHLVTPYLRHAHRSDPETSLHTMSCFLKALESTARIANPTLQTVTMEQDPRIGKFTYDFPGLEKEFAESGLSLAARDVKIDWDIVTLADVEDGWEWVQMVRVSDGTWLDLNAVWTKYPC